MLSTPGRISGLLLLSAPSSCCLVGALLWVAGALSDLWYRLLITKFSMSLFFPLLQMQRNKMAFSTNIDTFLDFLLISGSDSKSPFILKQFQVCFSAGLDCSPTPKLWSKCLPELWNISTSINSFFDNFSPHNQSLPSFLFRSQSKYLLR